jgi:two-component sensor histidine kinase
MADNENLPSDIETLLANPDFAHALGSDVFRRFLDQIPIAIAVSETKDPEQIVYANPAFEQISDCAHDAITGMTWEAAFEQEDVKDPARRLGASILQSTDFIGTFRFEIAGREPTLLDAYSNVIQDDEGAPCYRLAALVDIGAHDKEQREAFEYQLREKETLLLEVQHRVRNNLQMITALIRIEARAARGQIDTAPFDRLAGRIESIQLLYTALTAHGQTGEIDLGAYLSEIASSVLRSHAVEGIRLDLQVDSYPVSVNVAMPVGLVVNELLTNALKHAFVGRQGGLITLHSLATGPNCLITVADDGRGLPEGGVWPKPGKLGALIAQSLRDNAKADIVVNSVPGAGLRVDISFTRATSAPGLGR